MGSSREGRLRYRQMRKIPGDQLAGAEQVEGIELDGAGARQAVIIGKHAADRAADRGGNPLKGKKGDDFSAILDDCNLDIRRYAGCAAGEFGMKIGACEIAI